MLKGRSRDSRPAGVPAHLARLQAQAQGQVQPRPVQTLPQARPVQSGLVSRAPLARPEPDYEVVEFPSEQYVNAKLQPPPPPPPRPPTGHPADAGASCGLCGGGGARVRCAECGRRALCASCDDMYHRHPKRRHHQRQALSPMQMRDERPPLPPKVTAPVPPPRRHKLAGDRSSASPKPPPNMEQRRATLGHLSTMPTQTHSQVPSQAVMFLNQHQQNSQHHRMPMNMQNKLASHQVGSMPYLPTNVNMAAPAPVQPQMQANTLAAWGRQRGSLQGFNMHPNNMQQQQQQQPPAEAWESPESVSPSGHTSPWSRGLRRGASVLELGGCAACGGWRYGGRYGSAHSLDAAAWAAWPAPGLCCPPPPAHPHHLHPHHMHAPYTPQPYRRAESRASRTGSRAGSRAASPALSSRSRASRRKPRSPSPPPLPSSDADSESDCDSPPHPPPPANTRRDRAEKRQPPPPPRQEVKAEEVEEDSLGPVLPPPSSSWQCEHCTFVNEAGVRVCAVCCRTPTAAPRVVPDLDAGVTPLRIADDEPPAPARVADDSHSKQNGESKSRPVKERASTACGPSPPRDEKPKPLGRLVTPTRESVSDGRAEQTRVRHDMGVGPSPPRESETRHNMSSGPSSARETRAGRVSPARRSVSVGPSPPRDAATATVQKKSAGTSPPRALAVSRPATASARKVSNTGTSPPPQSISTQTYEVPSGQERAASMSRSRPRRRFRDDAPRERSHSRHSLSSGDTRESDRSARTVGGRWVWRDSSPADASGSERAAPPLQRRASHLDLRRTRCVRRPSYYHGSEAASPERLSSGRAASLEALVRSESRREAERGLELARLMTDAERLGFSAAEVHAALAQNPAAPLAWLRERWPSLCAGVRAAAARLAPGADVSEREARSALARHRGAMWPAVTECVELGRRGGARRVAGRVWGPGAGALDDAGAPRAEDSSDESVAPTPIEFEDSDWMYLPLDPPPIDLYDAAPAPVRRPDPPREAADHRAEDLASKLKSILVQAGVPTSIDERLLLRGLLADRTPFHEPESDAIDRGTRDRPYLMDFLQSENDFIAAYNALARSSPLPSVQKPVESSPRVLDVSSLSSSRDDGGTKFNEVDSQMIPGDDRIVDNDGAKKESKTDRPIQNIKRVQNTTETQRGGSDLEYRSQLEIAMISQPINEDLPLESGKQINGKKEVTEPSVHAPVASFKSTENITDNNKPISLGSTKRNSKSPSDIQTNAEKKGPPQTLDANKQGEEKSSNLSDIVDNTQRLIQQMKEEINSDINSLDSRDVSQSEADNTSNESEYSSEHESSYGDTEGDTEDMTSDEDENSSTEDEDNLQSQKSGTVLNRTSSEENDQFEEAMDHIEEQNESFKQTNIEILDSIARSLQEDHTLTLEINYDVESHEVEAEPEPKRIQSDELTKLKIEATEQVAVPVIESQAANNVEPPRQPNGNSIQQNTKVRKQDANNNLFVHANSFEEIYEQMTSPSGVENVKKSVGNTKRPKSSKNSSDAVVREPIPEPKPVLDKYNIVQLVFEVAPPNQIRITDEKRPMFNATIETLEDTNIVTTAANNSENSVQEITISAVNTEINQNTSDVEEGSENNEDEDTHSDSSQTRRSLKTPVKEINTEINEKTLVQEQKSEVSNNNQVNNNDTSHDTHIDVTNIANSSNDTNEATKEKSRSPEKQATNKSQIPKLIKVSQTNKQKNDKNGPKVLASKVPVRRGSIKQYPAPAPPKSHFGNVQNGHVKQLQTRLFNTKSKPAVPPTTTIEVVPSTSQASNKKKQAPAPPTKNIQIKQLASPEASPPKERKPYFRETCRTEDEWTESDSEDSQVQIVRQTSEEPMRAPSPLPPVTVRRVSGQLIDLARVRLLEGSPERQARMLLAEGALENWDQAQIAVELVSRGTDPPSALLAALECIDLNSALAYLHQECELCASRLPEHEMVSMLRCTHRCCRECARHYFTVQITERSIADCVCPYCKEPELETLPEDAWLEYFAHLDILLKTLTDFDVHELFQRKLRDRTLARDPNFRWCVECSSGFFVHPKQKRLRCPECKSVSCASCRKPWTTNHEGLSCEQYAAWLEDNDPERSVAAVQQHLKENGLECPRCHFKYSLSRGGCMHFTCTQCKYEFCYGCGKPFMMGARCGLSEYCARLGLHAHHPRNCLFYLRDKEPHELQTLLQMNNVSFEMKAAEGSSNRCPIQLQKETPTGLVDAACGSEVPPNHAGLCKVHYVEYLAALARPLDPIPIMDVSELVAELRRRALPLPERGPWDTDPIYAGMCAEIVREKIPLD